MASVKLTNVKKIYDNNVVAVHDFNLEIKDKEFVVFVGPLGCGPRGFDYECGLLVAPLLFRGRPANRIRRKKRTRGEAPENKQRSLKFFHTEQKCSWQWRRGFL